MERGDDDQIEAPRVPGAGERIWLHPSEFAPLLPAAAQREGGQRLRRRRSTSRAFLAVSVLSGTIGAGLPLGVVDLAGGFGPPKTKHVFERVADLSATSVAPDGISGPAAAVAPTVVAVRAATPTGVRFGSGVVFRSDGHVLTSSHLVDGATSIEVTWSDGRSWPARWAGSDPGSDLAVLSAADRTAIAAAVLGSAEGLRVGQTAIIIGAPAGPQGTPLVTVGVISAFGETTEAADHPLYDMISTDAAIAPRASGGPLVDRSGTVVGIVTHVETGEDRLGLVVPIDHARRAAEQLIASGRVIYPWLGVSGSDLDPGTAKEYGVGKGALIRQVTPRSPADQSSLKVHDVVTAIESRSITTMNELMMLVRRHEPGDVVELTIIRSGVAMKAKVRLADAVHVTGLVNVDIPEPTPAPARWTKQW